MQIPFNMKTTMSTIFIFEMYFKRCSLILSRVNQVKKKQTGIKKVKFPNVPTACKQTVPESHQLRARFGNVSKPLNI